MAEGYWAVPGLVTRWALVPYLLHVTGLISHQVTLPQRLSPSSPSSPSSKPSPPSSVLSFSPPAFASLYLLWINVRLDFQSERETHPRPLPALGYTRGLRWTVGFSKPQNQQETPPSLSSFHVQSPLSKECSRSCLPHPHQF